MTKPRRRPIVALWTLPIVLGAILLPHSVLQAQEGTTRTLSEGSQDAIAPQVGVDAQGTAVVVWSQQDGSSSRIQGRAESASGSLSPVQNLSGSGLVGGPKVAVAANGNAIVVWERFDGPHSRIEARVRSASGALSPVQQLSEPGRSASDPQVSLDPRGNAVVVWTGSDGSTTRIQARAHSASGTLGPVQTLSEPGQEALFPRVAVAPNGTAVMVWQRFDGSNWRVQARARSASGALGSVQDLSAPGQDAFFGARVGVDAGGNAVVVWERFDGSNWRIQARARSASGALGPVQDLSAPGQDASVPRVALQPNGNAVAVWIGSDGSSHRVQARARSASEALSPIQDLFPPAQNDGPPGVGAPEVAVDPKGNAVTVWMRWDGSNWRIQAVRRSASGTLTPVQTLSEEGQTAQNPQLALDGAGNPAVVWEITDGSIWRVEGTRLHLSPPGHAPS